MNIDALRTKYSASASGVYREFVDATSSPVSQPANNVVVVGQFAKGPIMYPTLCKNLRELEATFGTRDTLLEAQGAYSYLVAKHMLEAGPIYVLNVKNIDPYQERLQVKCLAIAKGEQDELLDEIISDVYDTGKFWQVDPMYGLHGQRAGLSLASVGQSTLTVLIEPYDSPEHRYTVAETKKLNPAFDNSALNDNALVSDYMIKLHVFKTDLAKAALSVSPLPTQFDLDPATIKALKADTEAKWFATYTGTVGDVIDRNGNNLSIVHKINADMLLSGLYAALNADATAVAKTDLRGFEELTVQADQASQSSDFSRLGNTTKINSTKHAFKLDSNDSTVVYVSGDQPSVGSAIVYNGKHARIISANYIGNTIEAPSHDMLGKQSMPLTDHGKPMPMKGEVRVYPSTSLKPGEPVEYNEQTVLWPVRVDLLDNAVTHVTLSQIETASDDVDVVVKFNEIDGKKPADVTKRCPGDSIEQIAHAVAEACSALDNVEFEANGATGTEFNLTALCSGEVLPYSITISVGAHENVATVQLAKTAKVAMGTMEVVDKNIVVKRGKTIISNNAIDIEAVNAAYGTPTKIHRIKLASGLSLADASQSVLAIGKQTINVSEFEGHLAVIAAPERISLHVIKGMPNLDRHYVNGTAARQNEVLDRLNDEAIMNAFADPTVFRCRYMIDSFKTYIEPEAKHQFAELAYYAKRFPVIGNAPFYHELRASRNPDFRDLQGRFKMEYVLAGANPDRASTNRFSYPTGEAAAFYVPYMNIMYTDGFSRRVVPAAGAVGKLYYSKVLGSTRKQYDIVAGPEWPLNVAGLVGPEFSADINDRKYMEKLGTNVLQTINGSVQIRSNVTAYQLVNSAFNTPDTIEKCLFISDFVEPALSARVFKMNSTDARLALKQKADAGCDIMVADQVITAYSNKCDADNNPVEVRKAGIMVLDTELYNEYGVRIAVHRTTVKDPEK